MRGCQMLVCARKVRTPYARSVRLKNLLLNSVQIAEPDWADLALESGFSDQDPHAP